MIAATTYHRTWITRGLVEAVRAAIVAGQRVTKRGANGMATNSFHPTKFQDFTIVRGNKRVGHVRLKPSGVLWAPVHSKVWYGMSLAKFAKIMQESGRRQKK
jgi:hypothetical protein